MDKLQGIKDYINQNQLKKVLFGGYNKEDVQMKFNMVQVMLDTYAKEQAEKEVALLDDFEKKLAEMKQELDIQKRESEVLIIDLKKSIVDLTEHNESIEKEHYRVREENDALVAENRSVIREQYKMKEAYKAYYGETLKKYLKTLDVISAEFTRMLENISGMQKNLSEESILEGVERALEMLGDNQAIEE